VSLVDAFVVACAAKVDELLAGRKLPSRLNQMLNEQLSEGEEKLVAAIGSDNASIKAIMTPLVEECSKVFDEIYEGCSLHQAKSLSSADRASIQELPAINLTYGEVKFDSLALAICAHLDMKGKTVFYDVGSGSGRGCFTASLIHDFTKIRGIEIVPGLHNAAKTQLGNYDAQILPRMEAEAKAKGSPLMPQDLDFVMADFRKFDWTDADIVWANSTCYGAELMKYLSEASEKLKEGTYFITLTQRLTSDHWELVVPGELYPMSWGSATIYIWRKIKPPSSDTPE
jgi:SAM-dependent methyltransferase